jgi:3-oxoacyl-[acyl-carrier-protein] synthase II
MEARDVIITGIGMVTSQGEGIEPHIEALSSFTPNVDTVTFAPYAVHPNVAVELDRQIPKKSDQRQMEPWQRYGTYAAGAALEHAGVKGNVDILSKMHLIVACGGGERDYAVDGAILTGMRDAKNPEVYLNERLMSDIRPTLFLAQLSNLLAGNISIVHGVIGGSRTFMGEEQSGVDALRIAEARIRSGQNDIFAAAAALCRDLPLFFWCWRLANMQWRAVPGRLRSWDQFWLNGHGASRAISPACLVQCFNRQGLRPRSSRAIQVFLMRALKKRQLSLTPCRTQKWC